MLCVDAWGDAATPRIALIIDDLGNELRNGYRATELDAPVACAVLPHTPYAEHIARRAHTAGKEVMLHLPLQPMRQLEATPAGTIELDTTRGQLARILAADLASVPYVVGVNNHQGSLLTQHPGHMTWLMQELRERGDLFFVDSYTSDSSVALRLAHEHGVPAIRRHIFLDNVPTRDALGRQFRRLKRIATERGVAVGIGHPYPLTLEFLEQAIAALRAEGFELVPVSVAIGLDEQPPVQAASLDR